MPPRFQGPTGTRDLYPLDLARRRWIEAKWRTVALRHGFDEVDGPAFEHTELYTVKSGPGIVSEIFGVFSGKDEAGVKSMGDALLRGEHAAAPWALRPEFTPTLARLYAARAAQLPKPTKWFWQQHCYRAEKPQRGRLREFMQWNCDVIGGEPATTPADGPADGQAVSTSLVAYDAEVIAACVGLLEACGLTPAQARVQINDRRAVSAAVAACGGTGNEQAALQALDARSKLPPERYRAQVQALGIDPDALDGALDAIASAQSPHAAHLRALLGALRQCGLGDWCAIQPRIARGLAYYTGMVFEVIAEGERAVAGGGRYDNLIETFGGPPTPACGFGMGDVVLSLLLQDKGLMPADAQIARELGLRPDVYVISNGDPASDAAVPGLLAALRRAGLHARRSYKGTKNIGKLLKEASDAGARSAAIVESGSEATVKDLDTGAQWPQRVELSALPERLRLMA
ncbi:MAG: hypothetical protein C0513_01495 [Isosphaera sp.]|nr:hypothetical protein [Isosphaera sp.]